MELQTTTTENRDILALLETESEEKVSSIIIDPLNEIDEFFPASSLSPGEYVFATESLLTRFRRASAPKIQFMFYYMSISTIVFFILLGATNWNSYSTVISAYMNPKTLTDSKADIMAALDKTRVIVYADSTIDNPIKEEEKEDIKKKLAATNVIIKEDRFSVKQLVQEAVKVNVHLDITPYDNRIIIPKIGKNIPLVDVRLNTGFDFDHIENIFMKELEK